MKTTAIAPWFGSNRLLAHKVGELLTGCEWVGVPFAGGMCELAHIPARTLLVNDKHEAVINLAAVVRDQREALQRSLEALPFHPSVLAAAQSRCRTIESNPAWKPANAEDALDWATDYFVCAWMGRNGTAGTDREFKSGLSVRWNAGGGDSAVRFRSATESLTEWQAIMRRCTFVCLDVFEFLDRVKDEPRHGLYLDPPFPGPGDDYRHKFTEEQQRKLAARLGTFQRCRVVLRYYDHELIRELYPEVGWTWHRPEGGRTQANKAAPEVLVVNRIT
jgi:site-specific DNA-adenine methylase